MSHIIKIQIFHTSYRIDHFPHFSVGEPVEDSQVVVDEEDFITAIQGLVPSVPEQELLHYKQIQQQFKQSS